jgi:hypothetical protein
LSDAYNELKRKIAEADPELAAFITKLEREGEELGRTNALYEQRRDVENAALESTKSIAEIIGDKNEIAIAESKLAEQAVKDAIQRNADLKKEMTLIDQAIKKLQDLQKARGLTPEEATDLKRYQDEAAAKQLVIDKSEKELEAKKKIAEAAALEAGAVGQAVREAEAYVAQIDRKVAALEKELEIKDKIQRQALTEEQQTLDLLEADKELLDVAKDGLEAELAKAEAEKDVDKQKEIRLKISLN